MINIIKHGTIRKQKCPPELQPYYDHTIAYLGDPDYESHANLEVALKEK